MKTGDKVKLLNGKSAEIVAVSYDLLLVREGGKNQIIRKDEISS